MARKIVALPDRGLVKIDGPDAGKFLQDLVTADIEGLAEGQAAYAGLLTPQGKILFDFFVIREEQFFMLDCFMDQREELIKRLAFYKLRAKLAIEPDGRSAAAVLEGEAEGAIRDPRTDAMGSRLYRLHAAEGDAQDYHRRRILNGLAEGGHDYGSGELFPHEANFDQIGAVSFHKGCFVGQEVVSRMEHRGTARSRILPCLVAGPLPARGSAVQADAKVIGEVCSGLGDRVLALLRLDRLEDASKANLAITAGASRIFPNKAPWARYEVPAFA